MATIAAFKKLNTEITALEHQISSTDNPDKNWGLQLAAKQKQQQETVTYQCETLIPARNKLRSRGQLLGY